MTRQRQWILQARESLPNDRLRSISRNQFERLDKTWFTGRYGFKDNFAAAEADRRRNKLKDKILAGVRNFDIEQYRKSDEEIQKILNTRVRAYYEAQNQKLNDWAEVDSLVWSLADDIIDSTNPDADHDGIVNSDTPLYSTDHNLEAFLPGDERTKRYSNARVARRALRVNVFANVLLVVAKAIAVTSTRSLSLIASLTDSALDLLCTMIVWVTSRLANQRMKTLDLTFPVGRRRLEPLGILVFSILMIVSFLQILQESVKRLLTPQDRSVLALPWVAIWSMAGNATVKGIIGIFYSRVKNSQVETLVQDCKTDVYFNTASLIFPLIGSRFGMWYLDPTGAAALSLYAVYDWTNTAFSTILRLTGAAVSPQMAKKLMYLAWRFSPVVDAYKSLTAYHVGDGIVVEVEIALDESTSLAEAHDISQTMQYCFEGLAEVDRSYVTVDYSSLGLRGHAFGSG